MATVLTDDDVRFVFSEMIEHSPIPEHRESAERALALLTEVGLLRKALTALDTVLFPNDDPDQEEKEHMLRQLAEDLAEIAERHGWAAREEAVKDFDRVLSALRAFLGPLPSEPEAVKEIRENNSIRHQVLDLKDEDRHLPRFTREVIVRLTDTLLARSDDQAGRIAVLECRVRQLVDEKKRLMDGIYHAVSAQVGPSALQERQDGRTLEHGDS